MMVSPSVKKKFRLILYELKHVLKQSRTNLLGNLKRQSVLFYQTLMYDITCIDTYVCSRGLF